MKKLKVKSDYCNTGRGLEYTKGQVIEVEDDLAAYLMTDSPGSFGAETTRKRTAPKGASNAKT